MCWCTFSKPFIIRRLCKYQPPESLQSSAMQMVSRHQVCMIPFPRMGKMQRQAGHTTYLKRTQTMVWTVSHLPQDSLSSAPATSTSPLLSSGLCVATLIGTGKALTCSPWAGGGLNLGDDSGGCLGLGQWIWHSLCLLLLFRKLPLAAWTTLGFCLDFFQVCEANCSDQAAFPLTFKKKKGIMEFWVLVHLDCIKVWLIIFFLLIASGSVVFSNYWL